MKQPDQDRQMELIEPIFWDDEKFSVGNELLDSQHHTLVATLNEIIICLRVGDAPISKLFFEFQNKAVQHLRKEERLLVQSGYPELQEHLTEHYEYEDRIAYIIVDGVRGQERNVVSFLKDWWEHHVLEDDMAYKEHLLSH
ncbi:MAG: hypothetical protein HOI61_10440 [Gammaproteobacteria bacterium]|jgi:hemerythrin|nr:hypothetical protein [Gammaproteobacteria bacterium]MBT4607994.1 hypothetical protein [Thiotrichales bacterium]MBT5465397.1 hypothetical protein [Candidatus Neomarinimicrobiota bacterium]MBT4330990.1 hypothetical protein [Gammaproteobacteria bacterium]MBT4812718.1 hypothetical protein [Thiotrichales bacterium]